MCRYRPSMWTDVDSYQKNRSVGVQGMGWLRFAGSFKLQDSFTEYRLFHRALLQKRPIILRSLLIVATPVIRRGGSRYAIRWLRMQLVWGLRKSRDASQPVNLSSFNLRWSIEWPKIWAGCTFARTAGRATWPEWIYSQGVYFEPKTGGQVRIFGFYNKKQTNKQIDGRYRPSQWHRIKKVFDT